MKEIYKQMGAKNLGCGRGEERRCARSAMESCDETEREQEKHEIPANC